MKLNIQGFYFNHYADNVLQVVYIYIEEKYIKVLPEYFKFRYIWYDNNDGYIEVLYNGRVPDNYYPSIKTNGKLSLYITQTDDILGYLYNPEIVIVNNLNDIPNTNTIILNGFFKFDPNDLTFIEMEEDGGDA